MGCINVQQWSSSATSVENEGRLLPRHVLWAGRVQGQLYVREQYDAELSRHVRVATLEAGEGHRVVLGPLLARTIHHLSAFRPFRASGECR